MEVWIYSVFLESAHIWRALHFLPAFARMGKRVDSLQLKHQHSVGKFVCETSVALLVSFLETTECNLLNINVGIK